MQNGNKVITIHIMEDKTELEEQIVLTPERISNALINQAKWKRILADPQVKEGAKAVGRTLVNTGIAAGELVPFLGEVGSWEQIWRK